MKNYFITLLVIFIVNLCVAQTNSYTWEKGGITRFDQNEKNVYLVFTGHEYADGADYICNILKKNNIKASFFFTGDFYRNKKFKNIIKKLIENKNYLGAHSDKHLLYCDWINRDSTLISKDSFLIDIQNNYNAMSLFGIKKEKAKFFMPPFEWYNDTISKWASDWGLQILNFSQGTLSIADYTTPSMGKKYISSDSIFRRILSYEENSKNGLNGFILLLHIGTDPERTDKMYYKLNDLIIELKRRGYKFKTMFDIK